jgi:subtilase family serine protease
VEPGGIINVTCLLKNQGTANAPACILRVYLSLDDLFDSADRQLAWGNMEAIDAGASRTVNGDNIPVPATVNNGKYFVIFLADADGTVNESIENNNQASIPLTVGNPALNPPRDLSASVSPSTVKLSWLEPEPGGGTLAGFSVYRNAVKIAFVDNPSTIEYTDTGLALGTYKYYVTASYSSPVGESSKSNEVQVTLSNDTKPDLTIQDFAVTPVAVAPGGSLNISCSLLNIGGAQAAASEIHLYLSRDQIIDANDISLAYGTMDPINAGDNISVTGTDISLPASLASGTWYALIMADANQVVDETNETNNMASVSMVVQGDAPDLQILGISFYPLVIVQRANIRITSTISNAGNVSATPIKVTFYLSTDEVLDDSDLQLFIETTRLLGAKSNTTLSAGFILGSNITPGQYFLIGVIDPDKAVTESDETNNQLITSVIVSATSGTDDILLGDKLRIYPVPATDFIHLDFTDVPKDNMEIVVFDAIGNHVYSNILGRGERVNLKLDVSNWNKGFYTIRVIAGGSSFVKKLLIQ